MTEALSPPAEDAPGAAPPPAWPGGGPRVDAGLWHLGWTTAFATLCGLALLLWTPTPRELGVLAISAASGLLGWGAGRLGSPPALILLLWTLAAATAAVFAGGAPHPLGALLLLSPLLAGIVMAHPGAGAVASLVAAAASAGLAAPHQPPTVPPAATATVLGTLAILVGAALAAGAVADGRRRERHAAPAPAGPGPAEASLRAELAAALAARDKAEGEARTRASFLANMSHELRTPLNAIVGFSDIMRTKLFGPLPDRYAEYAQLIHESGGHLLDLINDVLDISKLEADKFELRLERMDARDPVNAALRLMRLQADDAGVRLRASLPSEALVVDADARALKQIALNLLSNALKFTPRGGEVDLSLGAGGGEMELTVSDTGVGVSAEDLERLGRPYAQAEAGRAAGGTGLGLSLVKALTALHGGRFILESRLGEGAAATVRMPVLAG